MAGEPAAAGTFPAGPTGVLRALLTVAVAAAAVDVGATAVVRCLAAAAFNVRWLNMPACCGCGASSARDAPVGLEGVGMRELLEASRESAGALEAEAAAVDEAAACACEQAAAGAVLPAELGREVGRPLPFMLLAGPAALLVL